MWLSLKYHEILFLLRLVPRAPFLDIKNPYDPATQSTQSKAYQDEIVSRGHPESEAMTPAQTSMFDEDILLFRSIADPLDTARIEEELDGIPGAFRNPHEKRTWILVVPSSDFNRVRAWREQRLDNYSSNARVSALSDGGQVVQARRRLGRARNSYRGCSPSGPALTVRGKDVGHVAALSDIYAQTLPDPDETATPHNPPRTGRLTTLSREGGDSRELVAVHDAGFMSYTLVRGDDELTWSGRLEGGLRARWPELMRPSHERRSPWARAASIPIQST